MSKNGVKCTIFKISGVEFMLSNKRKNSFDECKVASKDLLEQRWLCTEEPILGTYKLLGKMRRKFLLPFYNISK